MCAQQPIYLTNSQMCFATSKINTIQLVCAKSIITWMCSILYK